MMSSKQFRLLTLFLVLNVTFQLISDATAAKIVLLFNFGVSVALVQLNRQKGMDFKLPS